MNTERLINTERQINTERKHLRTDRGGAGRRSRRAGLLVAIVSLALVALACSSAPPATAGQRDGVGTRSVSVELTGSTTYANSGQVTSGSAGVTYDSSSSVTSFEGTVTIDGNAGGDATVTFDLDQVLGAYNGTVRVQDPSAGIDVTVQHTAVPVAFDADGDASASAQSGGAAIDWSIVTDDATGLEPALDVLHDAEDDFCVEAQRILSGLDATDLPDAAVGNTVHDSRASFGSSKASLDPLAVQTWSDTDQVDTAAGNNVAISHRISCKTRAADHLATIGLPVGAVEQCSVLSQRSVELARAEMTPAELAAYDGSGTPVVFGPDRLAGTGSEYLTPFADEILGAGVLEVRAGSLRTDWEDPAYALLPDTIRGVHYCTVWSPAWAYWWMTEGGIAPV